MQIIILGAGKVGETLTKYLANEDHDVVIVDLDAEKVEAIVEQYDVIGVTGNGATYDVLMDAGVEHTDILIAVTESDELNILACLLAKQMGAKNCCARVRKPEYLKQKMFMRNQLGLSMIINPELEAANEIFRMLLFPSALNIGTFVGGRIELAEFRICEGSKLNGLALHNLSKVSKAKVLICAVQRKDEIMIPDGDFMLQHNDRIFVAGRHQDLARFCPDIGLFEQKIKRVMIVGGGSISFYLARQLEEQGIRVKLIENNPARCAELSQKLPHATVIQANGSDEEILLEEGIENTDAFISLTGLDEENIVISLYAKQMKVKKTVAKVTRMNFSNVLDSLDIDSIISPKSIIASQIIRYVRAKNNKDDDTSVKTLYKIANDQLEALEFVVTERTSFVNKKIMDLKVKENILIAAITRENGFIIPNGETAIHVDDHIVVVTKDQKLGNLNDIIRKF